MDAFYKTIIKVIIHKFNRTGVVWKVIGNINYGQRHLEKRQRRNELSKEWILQDYNKLILNIMNDVDSDVHLYFLSLFEQEYFCFDNGEWIVIVGKDGVIDTCMKGKPQNYFINNPGYTYPGKVKDVFE